MKLLTVLSIFIYSISSFAGNIICTGDTYPTIEFAVRYGELTVIDSNDKVVLDHEDGYNLFPTFLESLPAKTKYDVIHHEETKPELSFTIVDGEDTGWGYIDTYFYNGANKLVKINEKVLCQYSN